MTEDQDTAGLEPVNPPAFPGPICQWDDDAKQWTGEHGMSLRDYFAGQALAIFSAGVGGGFMPEEIAQQCYDQAAALLAYRDGGEDALAVWAAQQDAIHHKREVQREARTEAAP